MKQFLMIGAAALLAACAGPEKPDYWSATRAGSGAQTGGQIRVQTGASGTDYRAAAEAEMAPHAAMRPGLHKTRTGAPWLVAHSAGFQAGGARLTASGAAGAAIAYKASERKSPYAAKTHLGDAQTRFRIVTVDGSSFAVLFAISMPNAGLQTGGSAALQELTAYVAQISGCAVTGAPLAERDGGQVRRLAAPVRCS
ncbi:hypothetical protein [Leisingera sp. M523]|uniref:hypothetical protein n=1 Tax=Leisingera sp. M523 TaxID=2867013 RepID=UPI0021A814E4|nr:hypothetical protein [Leisingera sp. M523]UWQ27722.1 hypothetical protein K3557_13045 [Leisingera sp. M523]